MEDDSPRNFADRWLRKALHDPDNLAELLELVVPEITADLDFSQASYVERGGLRPDVSEREADVLVLLPSRTGDSELLCYILVEHQSKPDRSMPLRILEYATNTWRLAWDNSAEKPRVLPSILPILFYAGHDPWQAPPQLEDIIRAGPGALVAPSWRIHYLCLERFLPEDLATNPHPFVNALAIVRAERLDDIERLTQIQILAVSRIAELSPSRRDRFMMLMEFIASWITVRLPKQLHRRLLECSFERIRYDDREELMTMSRKYGLSYEEELDVARSESHERARKAKEEGVSQGLRTLLLQQVEAKFGSVSPELRERIAACTDDRALERAGVQLLSAASADDIQI